MGIKINKSKNNYMQAPPISEQQTEQVYEWLRTVVLSRTIKNIGRDFSDGVLMAEVMRSQYPQLVQIHNYQPTNSLSSKYINWKTLNEKVFRKIGFNINKNDIQGVIASSPGSIERVLHYIYNKILQRQQAQVNNGANLTQKLAQMGNTKSNNLSMSRNTQRLDEIEEEKNYFARQLSLQLAQKQTIIRQLRQTIEILETKMKKMEQLNKLKDAKIDSLMKKLDEGIGL